MKNKQTHTMTGRFFFGSSFAGICEPTEQVGIKRNSSKLKDFFEVQQLQLENPS